MNKKEKNIELELNVIIVIISIFQHIKKVFWAMHRWQTKYMKCPKCSKWSW